MQTNSKTAPTSDLKEPASAAAQVREYIDLFYFVKGDQSFVDYFAEESGCQGNQQQLDLDLQVLMEEGQMPEELK